MVTVSLSPNKNCNGDRSDGQTGQVVYNKPHQLTHQVQALQVSRSLHPTIRLQDLDASRGHITQVTGIWTSMSPKATPHLLYGAKHVVSPQHDRNTCWSARAPYWRPSNDESWFGLDTSPGTTFCARLFSRAY
ncbi:hypothetical protein DPMN_168560 [Dreissena polymorpha]|uniref:Uncharacterized protein n=1 Tax=Dreissena polymorpha TaxID=45954 RepID=A0A9D4F211_DREPO|nr:hypothetical protein DPMN_168560 [Dreissena polymorpha]